MRISGNTAKHSHSQTHRFSMTRTWRRVCIYCRYSFNFRCVHF